MALNDADEYSPASSTKEQGSAIQQQILAVAALVTRAWQHPLSGMFCFNRNTTFYDE